MDRDKKVILPEDPESAHYKAVTGWVSRTGFFFGKDERTARWSGSTHKRCTCGQILPKGSFCLICCIKKKTEDFLKMPKAKWNGKDALYSAKTDLFFFNPDELEEYRFSEDANLEDLMLIICEPIYAGEIDPGEYYESELPEDGEVPPELEEIFEELNKTLRESKVILSWRPGKYAMDLTEDVPFPDSVR